MTRRTDPATARAVVALLDGICLQVLLTDAVYDAEHTREMLTRLIPAVPVAGADPGGKLAA